MAWWRKDWIRWRELITSIIVGTFRFGHWLPSADSHFVALDASRATAPVEEIETFDHFSLQTYFPFRRHQRKRNFTFITETD